MRELKTESGAVYQISDGKVRRTNVNAAKRGDGDWHHMFNTLPDDSLVGSRVLISMSSLAHLGPDDFGTPPGVLSNHTTRWTTRVLSDRQVAE